MIAGASTIFGMQVSAAAPSPAAPQEVRALAPQARLSGRSSLRFLGLDIYEARLWADADFALADYDQQPFALELVYHRALSGQRIAERSLQEMRRQRDFPEAQASDWQQRMQALFPDVKAGDRVTGAHLPGVGARFWCNGRLLGELRDAAFARHFFGIWLSAQTSEPSMRCALAECR